MGRCGIGEVVPAIVFGLGAKAPLHGIVAHINQIGAGFLISFFGGAQKWHLSAKMQIVSVKDK